MFAKKCHENNIAIHFHFLSNNAQEKRDMQKLLIVSVAVLISGICLGDVIIVDDDGQDYPKADYSTIQEAVDASSNGDEVLVYPGTYTSSSSNRGRVGCPQGEIADCNGNCVPEDWLGDGYCDDGTYEWNGIPIYLNCEEFNWDGGDCEEPTGKADDVVNFSGKSIWLHSAAGPSVTFIDGQGVGRGVFMNSIPSTETKIEGFTIVNCLTEGVGAGMAVLSCNPTIKDCIFTNNGSAAAGGGLFVQESSPIIVNCTFTGNSADLFGGGIFAKECDDAEINNFNFVKNSSHAGGDETGLGGGLFFGTYENTCSAIITNCTFTSNTTDGGGGGLALGRATGEVIDCTFSSNNADSDGGGVYDSSIDSHYQSCTFSNNEAGEWGGGVKISRLANQGPFVMDDCNFIGNATINPMDDPSDLSNGGGLMCIDAIADLSNCSFEDNTSTWLGGAIDVFDGSINLTDCEFTSNGADYGGAINCWGSWEETEESEVNLTSNTFTNNTAEAYGGAIHLTNNSSVHLVGCAMSGNTAAVDCGDGIFVNTDSKIFLSNNNALDSTGLSNSGTRIIFDHDTYTTVEGYLGPSAEGSSEFDIDDMNTTGVLSINGSYRLQGGLSVTNVSESLLKSESGEVITLAEATTLTNEFDSILLPIMPEGLALELNTSSRSLTLTVVEEEGADMSNQFFGDLFNDPVDLINFDANGDGKDEIAILFAGYPGGVTVFDVMPDSSPTPIDGFSSTVGSGPISIDAGDLNGDGLEDLLVANSDDDTITVLLTNKDSNGTLTFDISTIDVPGDKQRVTCVAVIDYDGDSSLDAVVGIDNFDDEIKDMYTVLFDVATNSASSGPSFEIDLFDLGPPEPGEESILVSDPPTTVAGSADGFAGGTRYGRIFHISTSGTMELLGEVSGNNIVALISTELNDTGGDGQPDLLVASKEAESIYILEADTEEPDGFGDLIPITVSLPIEDVLAIDADGDGDKDLVFTAPESTSPLVLLRNGGESTTLRAGSAMRGRSWASQDINSGGRSSASNKVTGGDLDDKDEDDDWIMGSMGSMGSYRHEPMKGFRGGSVGEVQQINVLAAISCLGDLDGDDEVKVADLLLLIGAWGPCSDCPADLDGDGEVKVADLLLLIGAWGPCE